MDGRFDHLDLVSGGTSPRAPKTPRAPPPPKRDHEKFAREALGNIRDLVNAHQEARGLFPGYDLDLLFRMRVSKYRERIVTESLRHANCEPVVTRLEDGHDWVVRADDREIKSLKNDIQSRSGKTSSYIDFILLISGIAPTAKIGQTLRQNPLGDTGSSRLIVSFWRAPGEDGESRRESALELLRAVTQEAGFEVAETFVSKNMCQAVITSNSALLKRIAQIDYVSKIDRPHEFQVAQTIERYDYGEKPACGSPKPDDSGIAVMDTGVIRHPLLESALRGSLDMPATRDDSRSHGTRVAGMAAYASVEECITSSAFKPEVWIYSVQLVQESHSGKLVSPLPGSRIGALLDGLKREYRTCRVANVSLIEEKSELSGGMQAELSMVIDEMSSLHKDMLFVVATGNTTGKPEKMGLPYPDHLFADTPQHGILAPGTSSHAITVGSIRKPSGQCEYLPSSITRVGPGIGGAVKPELVHVGGDVNDAVIALNPSYRERWFATSAGTSLSAPIVSNYAARLLNLFPDASRNLITSLLLSSATLPANLPINISLKKQKNYAKALNVYGYGKPDLNRASHSDHSRVVLKHEGKIPIGHVEYFPIRIPKAFSQTRGRRTISVTLTFDPPCDPHNSSYMGTRMEFRLFANQSLADVRGIYASSTNKGSQANSTNLDNGVAAMTPSPVELKMFPSAKLLKKTNHQKGVYERIQRTQIDSQFPLILAVECESMWDPPGITEQSFSVVVSIAHEALPDLYETVRALNPGRARAR